MTFRAYQIYLAYLSARSIEGFSFDLVDSSLQHSSNQMRPRPNVWPESSCAHADSATIEYDCPGSVLVHRHRSLSHVHGIGWHSFEYVLRGIDKALGTCNVLLAEGGPIFLCNTLMSAYLLLFAVVENVRLCLSHLCDGWVCVRKSDSTNRNVHEPAAYHTCPYCLSLIRSSTGAACASLLVTHQCL
jgi:hypothetical protein